MEREAAGLRIDDLPPRLALMWQYRSCLRGWLMVRRQGSPHCSSYVPTCKADNVGSLLLIFPMHSTFVNHVRHLLFRRAQALAAVPEGQAKLRTRGTDGPMMRLVQVCSVVGTFAGAGVRSFRHFQIVASYTSLVQKGAPPRHQKPRSPFISLRSPMRPPAPSCPQVWCMLDHMVPETGIDVLETPILYDSTFRCAHISHDPPGVPQL